MKIYNLALLLLFLFPFAANESLEFPASSPIMDSQQKLDRNKSGVENIVFKSTDGGQSWKDISEGLPGDKLEGSLFVNDQGSIYVPAIIYITINQTTSRLFGRKRFSLTTIATLPLVSPGYLHTITTMVSLGKK